MWMLGGWLFVIVWSVSDVSKVNILWGAKIDSSCRIIKTLLAMKKVYKLRQMYKYNEDK